MNDLYTLEGEKLAADREKTPWNIYPRPQMVRDSFINLNGWWDFTTTEEGRAPNSFGRKIRVPFPAESLLSGIHEDIPDGSTLWYRRTIRIQPEKGKRVLLHVGAADQKTTLWIHEKRVKLTEGYSKGEYTHEGGYESFTYDITDQLKDEEPRRHVVHTGKRDLAECMARDRLGSLYPESEDRSSSGKRRRTKREVEDQG